MIMEKLIFPDPGQNLSHDHGKAFSKKTGPTCKETFFQLADEFVGAKNIVKIVERKIFELEKTYLNHPQSIKIAKKTLKSSTQMIQS